MKCPLTLVFLVHVSKKQMRGGETLDDSFPLCVCVSVVEVLQQQPGKQDSSVMLSWQLFVLRVQTCSVQLKFPR